MKQNYSYPTEMLEKAKLMFTVNFKDDYTIPGIHQDLFTLLVMQCQEDMTTRDFSITVLKFLKGQKYPDWKIADFYSYYEPSSNKPKYVEFKHTEQGKQLYDGDNDPKQLVKHDAETNAILENINLKIRIDELQNEIKLLSLELKTEKQLFKFYRETVEAECLSA